MLDPPCNLHSRSTLVGLSGLERAQNHHKGPGFDLIDRGYEDMQRADWEISWGLVTQLHDYDWVLVKWVTNINPVFTAGEIIDMAYEVLFDRKSEFPDVLDEEALLVRLLNKCSCENQGCGTDARSLDAKARSGQSVTNEDHEITTHKHHIPVTLGTNDTS
ncbi:hypothetical protein VTL71DRAFT_11169 [Oculimacula yallundae]|uniref:Uncharacterized protein n=1 Tax=Oculimacula yallundae TaxID=86028 RepID=A0ABR4CVP6_9HELO